MDNRASKMAARRRVSAAKRQPSLKKRVKTIVALLLLGTVSIVAALLIFFAIVFYQESRSLPNIAEIGDFQPSAGTQIFYSDGSVMAILATQNRTPVKLADICKYLKDATIATEDSRFYEHKGVDYLGICRAIWRNFVSRDPTGQGGSTITQQLARNINELGLGREKKLRRKVAEAILAMRIEQTFSKDEILELYLNQIYYGNGCYGAEAAAQGYFHKSAKDLSLGQAAMLAGFPQRPSEYSGNRDAALRRRDWVLERMVSTGKITPEERERARSVPLHIYKTEPHGTVVHGAPYFVNYVVEQLVAEYGADAVYSGWKIYTTLDSRMQKMAEQTLHDAISRNGYGANQACLVCMDPRTGGVRAMVGGLDYKRDQYNIVTQGKRQPGSSFKPIVYTAAINEGVCDLDKTYVDDPYFQGRHSGNKWLPKNYGGKYSGKSKTVLTAIKFSINTIAVKVAMDVGLDAVVDYAHRMGITSTLDKYPPLALGASAVRPIELCTAYAVFANQGKRVVPMAVTKIVANNEDVIAEYSPNLTDLHLVSTTLEQMDKALSEVVQSGTGTAARGVANAHGKTGTTSDNRDAWFAGYTPELVTVIWAGRENRHRGKLDAKTPYLEMNGATGGHLCAPMWASYMEKALPIQQEADRANAVAAKLEAQQADEDKKNKTTQKKQVGTGTNATAGTPENLDAPIQNPVSPDSLVPNTDANSSGQPKPPSGDGQPGTGTGLSPTPGTERPAAPDPNARLSNPSRRTANDEDYVTATVCAESGMLATDYCPTTVTKRFRRSEAPKRFCRLHRKPPGE